MPAALPAAEKCCLTEREVRSNGGLLVFADDWGRHPSSCQHLVRCLLDRHRVDWVNTIGTRTPSLNWSTVRRGFEKVGQWFRPAPPTSAAHVNLQVLNPRMWPWFGSSFGRWLNRTLLVRQLAPRLRSMPELPVAVTTIPLVSELIGLLPVRRWVYYCVDDFGQWPGLDQATLQKMEKVLVDRADTIIAVSEVLQERVARMGRSSHLLTHGVDVDFWAKPIERVQVPQLDGMERPLMVFWGVLDRRMDTSFVAQLDKSMSRGTIVLAGPAAEFDPALDRIPRVRRLGPLHFEQLPRLARDAAVLVMPYADLPVTRAIQPLKLKEYLATGRPVVVRDLPATHGWSDCLDLADTANAFAQAVLRRVDTGLPAEQMAARTILTKESWEAKARQFADLVFNGEAAAKW